MAGDGDDDEAIVQGTEGEGAEGQGGEQGEQQTELSAEHAEPEENDGEPEVAGDDGERPTRGQNRFQALSNQNRELKERAERAERERDEERRRQWQGQQQQNEQQEREMLALMTPDERADFRIKKFEERQRAERMQERIQTQVLLDKTAYDAKATINPVYAKYKDEVEGRFQEQLRKGQPVEREIILKLLLGERALNGATTTGARKQGQKRVEAQRVPAGGGKSDAASQRGRAGDTPESRLKDVFI